MGRLPLCPGGGSVSAAGIAESVGGASWSGAVYTSNVVWQPICSTVPRIVASRSRVGGFMPVYSSLLLVTKPNRPALLQALDMRRTAMGMSSA